MITLPLSLIINIYTKKKISYFLLVSVGFIIFFSKNIKIESLVKIGLNLLPFITSNVIKRLVNTVLSRFYFTNRKSAMLALDNFRAYNIYLFLNFYFSFMLGLLSVGFKLSKSVLALIGKYIFTSIKETDQKNFSKKKKERIKTSLLYSIPDQKMV